VEIADLKVGGIITKVEYERNAMVINKARSLLRRKFTADQWEYNEDLGHLDGVKYKELDDKFLALERENERLWQIARWVYSQGKGGGKRKPASDGAGGRPPRWRQVDEEVGKAYLGLPADKGGKVVKTTGSGPNKIWEVLE
jgi:hypothetical protein